MPMPRRYITDFGEPLILVNTATQEESVVDRYGVWEHGEVIKVGADLAALQAEYGPGLVVIQRPKD